MNSLRGDAELCRALTALLDSSADAFYLKDLNGRAVFVNEALARLIGKPANEILGKRSHELFPTETARRIDEDDRTVMESGEARTYLETVRVPAGERTYETTKRPHRDSSGKIIGLIGISREITEQVRTEALLKESEERFRGMFEQAPMSIQISTPDGRTAAVNSSWKELWAADDRFVDFVLNEYNMLKDPELASTGMSPYIVRAFNGENVTVPAIRYDPKALGLQGRARWVEGHFYPVRDREGKLREVILMHSDITERMLSEAALAESEAKEKAARLEAEHALDLRDKFLSIASHELKTPLTALSMQIQLVQRLADQGKLQTLPANRVSDLLKNARDQLGRFSRLVEDLLDVSRIAAGQLLLELKPVDLSALVRDVVESWRGEAERAGCAIKMAFPGPIPVSVDPGKIEQVLINLISNATKYAAGKPIHISVARDRKNATITVQDQGPGVSVEDHERIFDRFERAVSHRHFGGLGLGLYISRQIVDAHHGKIHVESVPGQGSKFIVELPLTSSGNDG